jgi:protein-L-isoaspartate(D-aspartate) O-methyltransferase
MTLQNFEKARENMVLSQLQPSGIVSEGVMAAYQSVPREDFVPNGLRGVSYLDDDIPLGGGRIVMEPLLHALMVQDAALTAADKVLDIGGATGYSAAVLAHLAGEVVALEQEEKLLGEANNHWKDLGLSSKITPVVGDHNGGYPENAPYRAIFINGAVAEIPANLLGQLAEGGVLYAVLLQEDASMGKIVAVRKDMSQTVLGEGVTSYVPSFAPLQTFIF